MKHKKCILNKLISFKILYVIIFLNYICIAQIVIDHTCTNLQTIPHNWIDSVKSNLNWYHAGRSHSQQVTEGLSRIASSDSRYNVKIISRKDKIEQNDNTLYLKAWASCYPQNFWSATEGITELNDILSSDPMNVATFVWCYDMNYAGSDVVAQKYVDSIAVLEDKYPDVTFIYVTGNAQASGSDGLRRHQANEIIRNWVKNNPQKNRILYDFADLDSWWKNSNGVWEHNTDEKNGVTINFQHSQFDEDDIHHTTYESCEQKGRAAWWMLARIAGWSGTQVKILKKNKITQSNLQMVFHISIKNDLIIDRENFKNLLITLEIINTKGQIIKTCLVDNENTGISLINIPKGLYFVNMITNNFEIRKKLFIP